MQQQQPPPPMLNMMPPFPPTNITTEQIQKYLDENKKLILAILDNQNLGKLAECAQYQAQLQKNLMYLAAIADAQPQVPPQMPPHPVMQQAGHYMQHPQAALAQQAGGFLPKVAIQYNPQQLQDQQHQQLQAALQGHMGMRPGVNNGMHPMHTEANFGGTSNVGPPSTAGLADFSRGGASVSTGAGAGTSSSSLEARGGSKPDGAEAGSGDQGNSTAGHSSANGEPSYMKGSEDAN